VVKTQNCETNPIFDATHCHSKRNKEKFSNFMINKTHSQSGWADNGNGNFHSRFPKAIQGYSTLSKPIQGFLKKYFFIFPGCLAVSNPPNGTRPSAVPGFTDQIQTDTGQKMRSNQRQAQFRFRKTALPVTKRVWQQH